MWDSYNDIGRLEIAFVNNLLLLKGFPNPLKLEGGSSCDIWVSQISLVLSRPHTQNQLCHLFP